MRAVLGGIAVFIFIGGLQFSQTVQAAEATSGAALDADGEGHELLQINGALAFELFEKMTVASHPAPDWQGASEKTGIDMRCLRKADWAYCEMKLNTATGAVAR